MRRQTRRQRHTPTTSFFIITTIVLELHGDLCFFSQKKDKSQRAFQRPPPFLPKNPRQARDDPQTPRIDAVILIHRSLLHLLFVSLVLEPAASSNPGPTRGKATNKLRRCARAFHGVNLNQRSTPDLCSRRPATHRPHHLLRHASTAANVSRSPRASTSDHMNPRMRPASSLLRCFCPAPKRASNRLCPG